MIQSCSVVVVEFPRRLLHLLRNRPFLCIVIQNVCGTYIIMGVFANMVRYLEIAFRQQAAVASIISGLSQLQQWW